MLWKHNVCPSTSIENCGETSKKWSPYPSHGITGVQSGAVGPVVRSMEWNGMELTQGHGSKGAMWGCLRPAIPYNVRSSLILGSHVINDKKKHDFVRAKGVAALAAGRSGSQGMTWRLGRLR
jgi:hypothetical protein